MRLVDVLKQRVLRVRLPIWADPTDYVTFDYLTSGGHGPWAHLYARHTQEAIGEPTPQSILMMMFDDTETTYEEYRGPIDPCDTRVSP